LSDALPVQRTEAGIFPRIGDYFIEVNRVFASLKLQTSDQSAAMILASCPNDSRIRRDALTTA
jgi:hypothetical protein